MNLVTYLGYNFYEEHGLLVEMVLSGNDLSSEMRLIKEMGIQAISLNRYFCKDRINDLDFLAEIPQIKTVHICDNDVFDYRGLYYLPSLEELSIHGGNTIDYSKFASLRTLVTSQQGPFNFPSGLKSLALWRTKFKDSGLSAIKFPSSLEKLQLYFSDITDLYDLPKGLKTLGIAYCRNLHSLDGLKNVGSTVTELVIENCPHLRRYSDIHSCKEVKYLIIADCREIDSISFVKGMEKLEHFAFPGTTVMDFDIEPLVSVPHIYFKNNKNYNMILRGQNLISRSIAYGIKR